jgi:hypothetical protein
MRPVHSFIVFSATFLVLSSAAFAGFDDKRCDDIQSSVSGLYSLNKKTYATAASCFTNLAFSELLADLREARPNLDPFKAKSLRKDVLKLREFLDLFVYAFPGTSEPDPILELRFMLDEGYTLLGELKDLFDVQNVESPLEASYDQKELDEKLAPSLAWIDSFFAQEKAIAQLLSDVKQEGYAKRKRKHLSFQFWGSSKVRPHANQLAEEAIESLIADLFKSAIAEYKVVRKIEHPAEDHKRIEIYHDFRKRIRSALKIVNYFSETRLNYGEQDLVLLAELVESYGFVSDMIIRYEKADEKKKKSEAKEIRGEIKDKWEKIQKWEKEIEIDDVLKRVYESSKNLSENPQLETASCQELLDTKY